MLQKTFEIIHLLLKKYRTHQEGKRLYTTRAFFQYFVHHVLILLYNVYNLIFITKYRIVLQICTRMKYFKY